MTISYHTYIHLYLFNLLSCHFISKIKLKHTEQTKSDFPNRSLSLFKISISISKLQLPPNLPCSSFFFNFNYHFLFFSRC